MARQSEQLEREAEQARAELAYALDELRQRLTPGEIIDELVDYARETPAADFVRNLARDIRANPLPVIVIFAGIAWAVIASSIAQRRVAARRMTPATAAVEVCPTETAPVLARQEWEVAPLNESVE
jgi:Protein of unknown function (DUF3618)